MQPGARYGFFPQLVWLCLALLLGVHRVAGAITLRKQPQQGKAAKYRAAKQPRKATTNNQPRQKTPPATPDQGPAKPPPLKKPKPLNPAQTTQEDPLVALDQLVVKQQVMLAPYIPLVQTIEVAIDYGRLAMNLWTPKERRYAGSLEILFRKNIQLSGTVGYNQLVPPPTFGNQSSYTVEGTYGCIGLAYFTRYDLRNNLYAGLRYGRSYFKNSTTPASPAESVMSKVLTASWWEMVLGSEHQLFSNFGLYVGLIFHLKGLGSFEKFAPAANYVVPGYGRSVTVAVPALTLYIKYKLSFLEKQITFK